MPGATTESWAPPDKTIIAGLEVVPERVTVLEVTTEPLGGEVRLSAMVFWMVPFSSGTAARICRMRLVDQIVTEKRIPSRKPTRPAKKIGHPKRLLRFTGINFQISIRGK